jgi:hypothetical protein
MGQPKTKPALDDAERKHQLSSLYLQASASEILSNVSPEAVPSPHVSPTLAHSQVQALA